MNADVTASCCRIFTVTGALDKGGDFFCLFHLKTEQAADFFCDRIAPDRTAVDRCFLIGDGRGEGIAAGVAAATAVIAGQTFTDGDLLFVYLYFEFLSTVTSRMPISSPRMATASVAIMIDDINYSLQ